MQYMTHAEHGRMPVYTPTEIEHNQKSGWVLEAEIKPDEIVSVKVGDDGTISNLKELYFHKFGKNPHHRMKPETIKAALDGSTE